MPHRKTALFLGVLVTFMLACSIARADYVTNHFPGGHGPFSAAPAMPTSGEVQLCCTPAGQGERWLGDEAGSFWAYPTPGQVIISKSSAPNTYAVAWEFSSWPWGRSFVITSTATILHWSPQLVTIQYDNACPLTPGMNTVHVCTGDWTPIDSGGVPTYVIANGIPKPGLPYGDYLKDTSGGAPGSWCTFNFSDFPAVPRPPGAPNHGVAVDSCP